MTEAVCCRCMEDFPVALSEDSLRMGLLFPLDVFTDVFRRRLGDPSTPYLCGNCYFDLTGNDV